MKKGEKENVWQCAWSGFVKNLKVKKLRKALRITWQLTQGSHKASLINHWDGRKDKGRNRSAPFESLVMPTCIFFCKRYIFLLFAFFKVLFYSDYKTFSF